MEIVKKPLIEFRDVTKRFDGNVVLNRVNFCIYENEITTLIGKSGTGKSVLLKHMIGLLLMDEGTILFRGKPVNEMTRREWDSYQGQISYMFQNNALFDSMTVFENVALPLRYTTKLKKKEIENKVMSRLGQLELSDVVQKYPSELSGGMQKRVALARALVTDPAIVLFDEPTTGQDPIRRNAILSMIANYRKKFGFTAVLVSHDIPDIFFISDRILLLWEGKIGFQGAHEELTRLDHPMIDEFVRSIEGLKDELTGLLSKKMFESRYVIVTEGRHPGKVISAVLFIIDFEPRNDMPGPQAATEFLKTFGEYVNKYFDPLGGFSARHGRGGILTLLPHLKAEEAEIFVQDFARELQKKAFPACAIVVEGCFDTSVSAGIIQADPADDIDHIMEKASSKQKSIAKYQCGKEECSK